MLINQNWGVQHVQFWNVGLKIKITIRRKVHWKKYCCCCCNGSETRYEGLPSYFSPISDQWHKVPKISNNQRQNEKPVDGQQLTNIYGQTTKNWSKQCHDQYSQTPTTNNKRQKKIYEGLLSYFLLPDAASATTNPRYIHQTLRSPASHIHPMSMTTNMSLHP